MEKEFVNYEQSLALKELGFDEKCFAKYVPYFSESGWKLELDIQFMHLTNSLLKEGFSAPLKQQVFRWFREKHNLMGIIDGEYNNGKLMFTYVIFCRDIDFDTYEEAENACIDKLIELAKKQENELD